MVAVKHQVLWRDGGGNQFIAIADILCGIFGGDVFKHHFKRRKTLAQRLHYGFDKAGFTSKISMSGHFTMYQQRHAQFCMRSRTGMMASILVTPWLELVVALAG